MRWLVTEAGADATVQTDNVQAGGIACRYMAEQIGGKGNVVIQNGPQVSAVIDRVNGCRRVLGEHPEIKLLSFDQDGKGSREGGLAVMQGLLTRFPSLQGVFTINDPQAISSDLAARQLNRSGIVITSVNLEKADPPKPKPPAAPANSPGRLFAMSRIL